MPEFRRLGRSDVAIAPLMLGANVFGWTADEQVSFAILDAFRDAGFNAVDTAAVYSTWAPGNSGGESETIIGNWLAARGGRDRIVVATKIGATPTGPDGYSWNSDLSASSIVRAVDASLRRLRTDYLDLCQVHLDDGTTAVEETLDAFAQLIAAGKVRAIGASHFAPARLAGALDAAQRCALPRYSSYQLRYNLLERSDYETAFLPLCREGEVSALCYSALAKGYLTGKYRGEGEIAASQWSEPLHRYAAMDRGRILDALAKVASEQGRSLASVALAWTIAKPSVAAAIVAANSVAELVELQEAAEFSLSGEQIAALEAAGFQ